MKSSFYTHGKCISFFVGLFTALVFWMMIFIPGGTGANVVLGLFAAIFLIYFIVNNLGPFIDDRLFSGGSSNRATLFRQVNTLASEIKDRLQLIAKGKKINASYATKDDIKFCDAKVEQSFAVLKAIKNNWTRETKTIKEQIAILQKEISALEDAKKKVFGQYSFKMWIHSARSIFLALLFALVIRMFFFEPFEIPSGSMLPTLLVGDHLFVNKLSYGISNPLTSFVDSKPFYLARWSTPAPGDAIVFWAPHYVGQHAGKTWIKRAIANAGQKVKVKDGVVYVDKKPYKHVNEKKLEIYRDYYGNPYGGGNWYNVESYKVKEKIGNVEHNIYLQPNDFELQDSNNWPNVMTPNLPGLTCDMDSCTVNEGYVFAMGDNRAHSRDSRSWGAIPVDNIIGKASFIWVSVDGGDETFRWGPLSLPGFRWNRLFNKIY